MNWRRLNTALHRDLGYLCVGLTLVYALSGLALNHTYHWNPNYKISRYQVLLPPELLKQTDPQLLGQAVLEHLDIQQPLRNHYRSGPTTLDLFMEKGKIQIALDSGRAQIEYARPRTGLKEINALHLNHPRRAWTWLADIYAVALCLLAITGLFILRGRNGLRGRGGWLTLAGIVLPIVVLLL